MAHLRAQFRWFNHASMVEVAAWRDVMNRGLEAATAEDVIYCFRLLLGRNPNPEEVEGHLQAVGTPLIDVVKQFVRSAEFDARALQSPPEGGVHLIEMEGYSLYVDPDDRAVGVHAITGSYEPHIKSVASRLIREGDTVIDIGANLGVFTAMAANLVGSAGRVISIEPNPRNCRYIEATSRANGWHWQQTHCVAASDRHGILSLHVAGSNGSVAYASADPVSAMRASFVQGVRLDDVLRLDRLDLVKIDVEGHEQSALTGFVKHLRFKPKLISEFMPTALPDPNGYLRMLHVLGYRLGVIEASGEVTDCGQSVDPVMHAFEAAGCDHIDLLATKVD